MPETLICATVQGKANNRLKEMPNKQYTSHSSKANAQTVQNDLLIHKDTLRRVILDKIIDAGVSESG